MNLEEAKQLEKNGYKIIYMREGPHYAKVVDPFGKYYDWVKSPNSREHRETTKFDLKDVMEFHGFEGEPFCFFCGRKQGELGISEGLELDHIIPIREGGKDGISNLQILCTKCHKLRHHEELYITKHLVRKEKLVERRQKDEIRRD